MARKGTGFIPHAVLKGQGKNRIEIMFSPNLDSVKIRAVVDEVVQRPYAKSEIFYDEKMGEAYFIVAGGLDEAGELVYGKFYLSDFKRVNKA